MRVVVGLGSNIGDRAGFIAQAIERLRRDAGALVINRSALYQSPPAGGPPQGDYLNAAVLLETALTPRALLDAALAIERALGRERRERWGPRTIDLDLLWIEAVAVREPGLEVPHPRLEERPFALRPLLDVAPDARHPLTGRRLADAEAARLPLERWGDRISDDPAAQRARRAEPSSPRARS